MKIGDRVRYDDECGPEINELEGTIVEPTDEERNEAHGGPIDPYSDVVVEWDDGKRLWEMPESLVVIQEAGS